MSFLKNSKKSCSPIENMKEKLLNCLTCTVIEIMTAIGVTVYLLYLNEPILVLISTIVFAKLIVFHFIMDYYDKKQRESSQTLSLKKA
jgi:hypothetical protein